MSLKDPYPSDELKSYGFKFNITKNLKEIYNNKEFLKSHKKQIEDFYGLSG